MIPVSLHALGLPVVISCPDETTAARVRQDWSRCLDPLAERHIGGAITVPLPESEDLEGAQYLLASEVTVRLIDELAGSRLIFHASGLSTDRGEVVALVAASGTGKSTAALRLATSAFGYVTDEAVVINEDLSVDAYPKPLSLFLGLSPNSGKTQCGPTALGLRPCPTRLHLGRVVILDRRPEVVPARFTPIRLIDAMLELIPQTSGLPTLPRPLRRLAEAALVGGGTLRLTYSEILDAHAMLQDLLDSPSQEQPEDWWPVEPAPASCIPWRDGRLQVAAYQDAVGVEDETLLLVEGVPMRLGGIGATIWSAVRLEGRATDELLDLVVAAHGPHPQSASLVASAVRELIEAGALSHALPATVAQVMAGCSTDIGSWGISPRGAFRTRS